MTFSATSRLSQGQTCWVSSVSCRKSSRHPVSICSGPQGLRCAKYRTGIVFWLLTEFNPWETLTYLPPRVAMTNCVLHLLHPPRLQFLSGRALHPALRLQGLLTAVSCAALRLEEVTGSALPSSMSCSVLMVFLYPTPTWVQSQYQTFL